MQHTTQRWQSIGSTLLSQAGGKKVLYIVNIINYVKVQRLSWFGHINRMPETSIVRKYTNGNHLQVEQWEGLSPDGKTTSGTT